eukprot:5943851-Amphidinium_carterae.1
MHCHEVVLQPDIGFTVKQPAILALLANPKPASSTPSFKGTPTGKCQSNPNRWCKKDDNTRP